jgi:hypothetical protein
LRILIDQVNRYESQERQTEEKLRERTAELERRLEDANEEKKTAETLVSDLTRRVEDALEGKRSFTSFIISFVYFLLEKGNADARLNSLQAVFISQEELIRAIDAERSNAHTRLSQLEAQLKQLTVSAFFCLFLAELTFNQYVRLISARRRKEKGIGVERTRGDGQGYERDGGREYAAAKYGFAITSASG